MAVNVNIPGTIPSLLGALPVNNKVTWDPIRLTYKKPVFTNNDCTLANRKDIWHKFIVFHSGTPEKQDILYAIISAAAPEVLIPVFYNAENKTKCSFLTKCGAGVIDNLMKFNLQVPITGGEYVRIDIVLGFQSGLELQFNPQTIITRAAHYRYEPFKKVLNLQDFHNSKALGPIYCPLALPKVLNFVLRCARSAILGNSREMRIPVRELCVRSNNLMILSPHEKFFNYHLTKLDIRNNKITDFRQLTYFSEFNIMELWVDGNPLCTKYTRPDEYVRAAKAIFPHLQILDGVMIGVEKKFVPTIQKHYLGDGFRLGLVKQFVWHFFSLYDQSDRFVLNGLYDTEAMFSMTLGSVTNFVHTQITKSFASNRNLLKFVDYAKCHEFLLHGPEEIIYMLRRQPQTIHNTKTFQIDLMHQSHDCFAISIQGFFSYRDYLIPPMTFNRTFIVIAKEDNEFCICNDQYHIESVPSDFKFPDGVETRGNEPRPPPRYTPVPLSKAEREQLLRFLHELTGMNRVYCEQFLEKSAWDVRAAIKSFMHAYTINDVSSEAFC